ncbi:MAG: hypothetical protein RIB84_23925 [Sneathiellaceae bacterium]
MARSGHAVIGLNSHRSICTFAADGATWDADYPVTNLGSLPLARVARTDDASEANTKFTGLFSGTVGMRLLLIGPHNMLPSTDPTYRLRLYSDAGLSTPVYDSGAGQPVWPAVYDSLSLEWEDDQFWTGAYADAQVAAWDSWLPIWLDQIYLCRGFRLELSDTSNADGYIQAGLVEPAMGHQFSANVGFGAQYGFRFRSTSRESDGGSKAFRRRRAPQVWEGEIRLLARDEAMARYLDLLRQNDLVDPVAWFPHPEEPLHWPRTVWLARIVDPGLSTLAGPRRDTIPIKLEQVL